jgi:hypothetical protein
MYVRWEMKSGFIHILLDCIPSCLLMFNFVANLALIALDLINIFRSDIITKELWDLLEW